MNNEDMVIEEEITESKNKNEKYDVDKEERASQYFKMYEDAYNFDPDRFDKYTELLAYYEMEQDKLPANQTNKPWVLNITTPYAADAINVRAASLHANDYVGELEPLAPDDVENVKNLNNIYHMFWNSMNMDKHINMAILYCMILRETYVHIIYEDKINGGSGRKNSGKLSAYFIDPASILIDPKALSFKDADYIVVTERISKKQYKRVFGKPFEDGKGATYQPAERGEIYLGSDYDTNQDEALTKLTFYIRDGENVKKVIMVERKIESEDELPITVYPIAQLRWEKRVKSAYGKSLLDRLLGLQKSINAIESASTTAALAFASPSYVVRQGSGIDPRKVAALAGAPGTVFEANGDPKNAVVTISNTSIDPNLMVMRKDNQSELYRLAGVSEQFLGSFGSAGNTKGGSEEASTRARIIEQLFLSNLEEFIEDLTEIIVNFITRAFSGETVYSRGNKKSDGTFDFQSFPVGEELQDIEYSFYINMDVRTPYSKEKTKRLMQELYQMERQYDAPVKTIQVLDIIEQYDVPNKEELVVRYKNLSQKDSQAKADAITQWVTITSQYGVDANMISQGIIEIIDGKEIPTVDAIIAQIEQQVRANAQQEVTRQQQLAGKQGQLIEQQMIQQDRMTQQQAQQGQQITGDEKLTPQNQQQQMTGDEELALQ